MTRVMVQTPVSHWTVSSATFPASVATTETEVEEEKHETEEKQQQQQSLCSSERNCLLVIK